MRRHLISGQAFACSAIALAVAMLLASAPDAAELPPEIQIDRLLVQAERDAREGYHRSAVYTLERALGLHEEHGLEVPPGFWFRQARAFQDAEMHDQAVEASTRYLQDVGRQGETGAKGAAGVLPQLRESHANPVMTA